MCPCKYRIRLPESKNMVRRAVAFDAQRRISDPLFVLVLVLVFGFSLLFNFMTYHGSNSSHDADARSQSRNDYYDHRSFGYRVRHVRPRDLGISWRNVAIGGAAFPLAWCAFAIAEGTMGFAGANFALNSAWKSGPGIDGILSDWVGQIFGNAPYEELFRAFLIPQIYLRTLNPFVVSAFHALWNFPQPIYYSKPLPDHRVDRPQAVEFIDNLNRRRSALDRL